MTNTNMRSWRKVTRHGTQSVTLKLYSMSLTSALYNFSLSKWNIIISMFGSLWTKMMWLDGKIPKIPLRGIIKLIQGKGEKKKKIYIFLAFFFFQPNRLSEVWSEITQSSSHLRIVKEFQISCLSIEMDEYFEQLMDYYN